MSIKNLLPQAMLYSYRYILGYGLLILVTLGVVVVDISLIPRGITQPEMLSVVESNTMSVTNPSTWIVDAPYHLLQKFSLLAFGVSKLSIVLPSVVFAFITATLMLLVLRLWFKERVALVATLLGVSSPFFIAMARTGTPLIMLTFWTLLLLFAALHFLVKKERAFGWKLLITIASVGLIYTPGGLYPFLLLVGSGLFHPHIRARLRRVSVTRHIILASFALLLLVPLIGATVMKPSIAGQLLGVGNFPHSLHESMDNLRTVALGYFNVTKAKVILPYAVPLLSLPVIAFVVLGIARMISQRYMARAATLLVWTIGSILLVLISGQFMNQLLLPVLLAMGIGIDAMIREWYKLFPNNPYARIAGILPLSILFLGMIVVNISQYFNVFAHTSYSGYSEGLSAVQTYLKSTKTTDNYVVTNPSELSFYDTLRRYNPSLRVTTTLPETSASRSVLVLPNASVDTKSVPKYIVTDNAKQDSVALRVY